MSWTDQEIETLRAMWNAGDSASEIAAAFRGKSRNAVLGKVHRLGEKGGFKPRKSPQLPRRAATPKPVAKPAAKPVAAKPDPVRLDVMVPPAPPAKGKVTLETVGYRQCRFPMGDPRQGADMPMCGQKTEEGRSYCDAHRRITNRKYLAWGEAR
jgi:GcrA cell cycle regulator